MTKQKSRTISKHPAHRRTTFRKHNKPYVKVYAPYLPAVVGLVVGLSLLLSPKLQPNNSVLSYASATTASTLLEETNERRTDNNSGELKLNPTLANAAQAKAADMAAKNYWAHTTPDGKEPWYFIEQANYSYSTAAENLAYGFDNSEDTIKGWMNSEGHRKVMLDTKLSEVGFGIVNIADYQNQGPQTVVVAMYASPANTAGIQQVNSNFTSTPASTISFGQVFTGGVAPWINFLAGLSVGIAAMYLVTKHSLKLRRKIRRGERYILRHPVVDVSLLSIIVLMVAISQTVGFVQ